MWKKQAFSSVGRVERERNPTPTIRIIHVNVMFCFYVQPAKRKILGVNYNMRKIILTIILSSIVSGCVINQYVIDKQKWAQKQIEENHKRRENNSRARIGFQCSDDLIVFVVYNNAKKYGLELGDKIIAVNGQNVSNMEEYLNQMSKIGIGDNVNIRIVRNSSENEIAAKTIDTKSFFDSEGKIYKYLNEGQWQLCLNEIDELIAREGSSFYLMNLRVTCMDCMRMANYRSVRQNDAIIAYEAGRLLVKEAFYHPKGVESVRSNVLYVADFLSKNGFNLYAYDLKEILDKTSSRNSTSKGTKATGTGFSVSSDGFIATAYHVVEDAASIKVHLNDDSVIDAKIHQIDPSNDLAILKINASTPFYLPIIPFRTAKSGDKVFTLGFPMSAILGQEVKYTEGVISSLSGPKGAASFLQITVPVQPGNSGGPLVNEEGYVVGIICSSAAILPFLKDTGTIPQNINWAIKSDYLRPLIELPTQLPKAVTREEAIKRTRESTFLIEVNN